MDGLSEYKSWISELKLRYQNQQIKAAMHVNSDMLLFYWNLGKDIAERQFANTYGSGFFKKLSADLLHEIPDAKGFSPNNLWYIKRFYDLYSPIVQKTTQLTGGWQNFPQLEGKLQAGATECALKYLFMIPW